MKPTKKALLRRAKMWYTGAIVAGVASLLAASGIETAATFSGMIGYCLLAVAIFALTIPCVIEGKRLDDWADDLGRPVHRSHTYTHNDRDAG